MKSFLKYTSTISCIIVVCLSTVIVVSFIWWMFATIPNYNGEQEYMVFCNPDDGIKIINSIIADYPRTYICRTPVWKRNITKENKVNQIVCMFSEDMTMMYVFMNNGVDKNNWKISLSSVFHNFCPPNAPEKKNEFKEGHIFNSGNSIKTVISLENSFEKNILQKLGPYKKNYIQGIYSWYPRFFFENQLYVWVPLLLFLLVYYINRRILQNKS